MYLGATILSRYRFGPGATASSGGGGGDTPPDGTVVMYVLGKQKVRQPMLINGISGWVGRR